MNTEKIRFAALIAILGAMLLCPVRAQEPIVPLKFAASIGGFTGASYAVELASDGKVVYLSNLRTFTSGPETKRKMISIPAESWRNFRKNLDAAQVWSWHSEYADQNVADGTVWRVEVVYPDRKIASHGSNAFPPELQFEQFRLAIRELIGGEPFE